MPLCKKCGAPIIWNRDHYAETGKWIPYDEDTDEPHDCPQSDWGAGSSSNSGGGSNTIDAIIKLEDKMDQLNKNMLKLILAIQTVQQRIEGQMPLFPTTSEITAKPVSKPILDPARLTEEG